MRAYPNAEEGSDKAKVLLFSNAASKTSRSNGTVRVSCDDGQTWPVSKVFTTGAMAYSTLATLPDGTIGLLWEPGHNGIVFSKFNMAWLEGVCAPMTAEETTIERGTSDTVEVTLQNQLGPVLKIDSITANAPEGWSVDVNAPKRVQPHRSTSFDVSITVPASAAGGNYEIPLTLTTNKGRSSQGVLTVIVPKTADEVDGRISVKATHTNPKSGPYAVGDVLRFKFEVTNLSSATTTVVPTGNLENLDPNNARQNCRYRQLGGNASYTCTFPFHVVTQADLDAGSFTPNTSWVSTSGSDVTTVNLAEPTVTLK